MDGGGWAGETAVAVVMRATTSEQDGMGLSPAMAKARVRIEVVSEFG